MLNSILFYVLQLLIIDPVQSRVTDHLARANVPPQIIAQIQSCATSALPVLIQRVADDPLWGAQTAMKIWVWQAPAEQIIGEIAPGCETTMQAANTYLRRA